MHDYDYSMLIGYGRIMTAANLANILTFLVRLQRIHETYLVSD
jgi:hypothetical protein